MFETLDLVGLILTAHEHGYQHGYGDALDELLGPVDEWVEDERVRELDELDALVPGHRDVP